MCDEMKLYGETQEETMEMEPEISLGKRRHHSTIDSTNKRMMLNKL